MSSLSDDAMLAELLGGLYQKIVHVDFILRAGHLPKRVVETLVECKLELFEITRRLRTALEAESDEPSEQ